MMLGMRMGGCNILIANPRDIPARAEGAVAGSRFHSFPAVNTLFNALAHHPDFDTRRLEPPEDLRSAAAWRCSRPPRKLWLEKTGCPICEGYGLSRDLARRPPATRWTATAYSGTIGLPMPSTELTLLDDDGHEVPLGTPGEIAIRGPQVMAGYWQRPDETAKVMTADGFFRTGDIGVVDERGYFKHRRPQEGHDPGQRLQRLPERGRGRGHADARRARVRRRRRARRQGRRGGQAGRSSRSDPALTEADVRAYCEANLTGYKRPEDRRVPRPTCPRRRWARSCAASCATRPEAVGRRPARAGTIRRHAARLFVDAAVAARAPISTLPPRPRAMCRCCACSPGDR